MVNTMAIDATLVKATIKRKARLVAIVTLKGPTNGLSKYGGSLAIAIKGLQLVRGIKSQL